MVCGGLWWFAVVCGGLWWIVVVCLLVIPVSGIIRNDLEPRPIHTSILAQFVGTRT